MDDLPDELLLLIYQNLNYQSIITLRHLGNNNLKRISNDYTLIYNFVGDKDIRAPHITKMGLPMFEGHLKYRCKQHHKDDILLRICSFPMAGMGYTLRSSVKILLKHGANPNGPESNPAPGRCKEPYPLARVVRSRGNLSLIDLLLKAGANVIQLKVNILDLILRQNHEDVRTYFFQILNTIKCVEDLDEALVLHTIIKHGDKKHHFLKSVFFHLIESGVDVNKYKKNLLLMIAHSPYPLAILLEAVSLKKWNNPIKIFDTLLKNGADPRKRIDREINIYEMFILKAPSDWEDPIQVIKLVQKYYPDLLPALAKRTDFMNRRLLNSCYLGENVEVNTAKVVSALLQNGLDVNSNTTILGPYPLHLAVKTRNLNLVRVLLQYSADPNVLNDRGEAPLHNVKVKTTVDVFGRDANESRDKLKRIINVMLKIGANPELENANGETVRYLVLRFLKLDLAYQKLI